MFLETERNVSFRLCSFSRTILSYVHGPARASTCDSIVRTRSGTHQTVPILSVPAVKPFYLIEGYSV